MGKKKKEKQRKRVSADAWVYNGFFRWNHRRIHSVGDSIGDSVGDSATSLYGYLSLNPSVKSSDVTTPLYISRQTVYPVGETVGIYRQSLRRNYYRRNVSVGNSVDFLRFSGNGRPQQLSKPKQKKFKIALQVLIVLKIW
jgi:hypothetical protein